MSDGLILFLFALFCIAIGIITYVVTSNRRGQQLAIKNEADMKLGIDYYADSVYATHMSGLPIVEGIRCEIFKCRSKYVFKYNQQAFNLALSKINDVVVKTETEIQNAYVSSAGGAVAGGMMFGALGALIGGRTQKKTETTTSKYMIFTYEKNNKVDFISFDCTNSGSMVYDFVKDFNRRKTKVSNVDL